MSKWRPKNHNNLSSLNCIYTIPDIHGNLSLLQLICDRILPLRKSDGGKDKLIFLGDYIDRHVDSHKVLDFLIELEKKYEDQVVFLMGNHELMVLEAFNLRDGIESSFQNQRTQYNMWVNNGGFDTIAGYMDRSGISENILTFPKNRVLDLIPKEHISFLQRLKKCYELDDYVFVHGGLDPLESPTSQDINVLVWDRSLVKFVLQSIKDGQPLPWEKVVVTGHNVLSNKQPVITDKFMMLDCGSPKKLLVVELRSNEAYIAYNGNNRLVKYNLIENK